MLVGVLPYDSLLSTWHVMFCLLEPPNMQAERNEILPWSDTETGRCVTRKRTLTNDPPRFGEYLTYCSDNGRPKGTYGSRS